MKAKTIKSSIYFAKHRLLRKMKGERQDPFPDFMERQTWPLDRLEEHNFALFKSLLTRAYENAPFYKAKYAAAGLEPGDIRTPDDIDRVPLLTREEVRHHAEEMICRDVPQKRIFKTATGGTTGVPLSIYHEHAEPFHQSAWRMLSWWKISPVANFGQVKRASDDKAAHWHLALWNWPKVHILLNAALMTPESMDRFIKQCFRHHIEYLCGYEGGLHFFAEYVESRKISLPLKAVWSTSAPLPDYHREFFSRVFQCPVYDQYGSCEIQWLSAECSRHRGLHMFWDIRRIEFVDERGKNLPAGESGKIVVTDLLNFSFPMIRYENGDIGRRLSRPCDCGITFPLMDRVKGRTTDMIVFRDGSRIAGDYLTTIFDKYPEAVRKFQVRQASDGSLVLRYVPGSSPSSAEEFQIVFNKLKGLIGGRAVIRPEKVENIPHDRGKYKYIVSERTGR